MLRSYGRRPALAAEPFMKLGGISKGDCFVNRLGALVPWRHFSGLVEGDHRPGVQVVP
jgi:hypothetical protein